MDLSEAIAKFNDLHVDRSRGVAPHKPIMVLSILDLIERGLVTDGNVVFSEDLLHTFRTYWEKMGIERGSRNPALPFYHLKSDGILEHIAVKGKESALAGISQIKTISGMEELVDHATIPGPLWEVLKVPVNRKALMDAIVETYFSKTGASPTSVYDTLREEIQTTRRLKELQMADFRLDWTEIMADKRRDYSFRDAILFLYDFSCAVCRLRLKTSTGNTIVDASHIAPFNRFQNDDLRNGIALCKTHHWLFDEGLISLDADHTVLVSNVLHESHPTEWYITQYKGMKVRLPQEKQFHPHPDAIEWHRENVYWGE
jgi:putative restriction endonuclease